MAILSAACGCCRCSLSARQTNGRRASRSMIRIPIHLVFTNGMESEKSCFRANSSLACRRPLFSSGSSKAEKNDRCALLLPPRSRSCTEGRRCYSSSSKSACLVIIRVWEREGGRVEVGGGGILPLLSPAVSGSETRLSGSGVSRGWRRRGGAFKCADGAGDKVQVNRKAAGNRGGGLPAAPSPPPTPHPPPWTAGQLTTQSESPPLSGCTGGTFSRSRVPAPPRSTMLHHAPPRSTTLLPSAGAIQLFAFDTGFLTTSILLPPSDNSVGVGVGWGLGWGWCLCRSPRALPRPDPCTVGPRSPAFGTALRSGWRRRRLAPGRSSTRRSRERESREEKWRE